MLHKYVESLQKVGRRAVLLLCMVAASWVRGWDERERIEWGRRNEANEEGNSTVNRVRRLPRRPAAAKTSCMTDLHDPISGPFVFYARARECPNGLVAPNKLCSMRTRLMEAGRSGTNSSAMHSAMPRTVIDEYNVLFLSLEASFHFRSSNLRTVELYKHMSSDLRTDTGPIADPKPRGAPECQCQRVRFYV